MARIDAVLSDLPEQAVKTLTPWDLETAYRQQMIAAGKGMRKNVTLPENLELPTELDKLCVRLRSLLRLIGDLKVARHEYEHCRQLAHDIERDWEYARYNLFDPGHKRTPPWELDPMHDDITPEEDED